MTDRFWDLSRTHPFLVVVLTIGVVLMCLAVALTVATGLYAAFSELSLSEVFAMGEASNPDNPHYTYFLLLLSNLAQVLGFGLAAWLVATGYPSAKATLGVRQLPLWPAVLAAAVWIIVSQPLFTAVSFDANSFELPESLKEFERSAEAFEAEAAEQFRGFFRTIPLPLALFSIAVLPAICEELLFRGLLLSVFRRWLGVHAAVWVQGVLFSLVHGQVFGFLPRMLMGVAFGYLRVSSGSLIPAVVAHFVNNAVAVIAAYQYGMDVGDPDPLDQMGWFWVGLSGLFSAGILVWLYRTRPAAVRALPDPTQPEALPVPASPAASTYLFEDPEVRG